MALIIILLLVFSRKVVNWNVRYALNIEDPYGISMLRELMKQQYGAADFQLLTEPFSLVYEDLDDSRYAYIYIGHERDYDPVELASIMQFVSIGNDCFLSTESINVELIDSLFHRNSKKWPFADPGNLSDIADEYGISESFGDEVDNVIEALPQDTVGSKQKDEDPGDIVDGVYDTLWIGDLPSDPIETSEEILGNQYNSFTDYIYRDSVLLNFSHFDFWRDSGYPIFHFYHKDTIPTYWNFYDPEYLSGTANDFVETLGIMNHRYPNFIRIAYGDGFFYFHSTPLAFTNVDLLERDRLEYAEKTLAYLSADKLLWDDYEHIFDINWDLNNTKDRNPLSYILSEPPLRWSLYLILAGSLLFILFRAKRRQQFIPVIEPNVNTSLEYVEMIGQLYYEQKDHRYISNQLWRQFMDFIRSHYYIGPAEIKGDWVTRLAVKSRIPADRIRGIARAFEQTGKPEYQEEQLLNFYHKLKYFYSNCK